MDNTHCIFNIIRNCKVRQEGSTAIFSLDVEKTFDCVEAHYLSAVLEHMAFGPRFCAVVKAISKDPLVKVKINRLTSKPF